MPKRTAIARPLGLAFLLALGFGTAWAVLVFWIVSLAEEATRGDYHYQRLVVRADGTPLVWSYEGRSETFQTLDGKELQFPFGVRPSTIVGADLGLPWRPDWVWTGLSWAQRLPGFSDYQRTPAYWYFIHDGRRDGSGYFEGYDSGSYLPIGYIGQKGFNTERPPEEEWIPLDGRRLQTGTVFSVNDYGGGHEPGYYGNHIGDENIPPWMVYMISGDRLLEFDFRRRTVRTALEAPGMMSVALVEQAFLPPSMPTTTKSPPPMKLELAVRFPDRVLVFHPGGGPRRTYPLRAEVGRRSIQFYELSGQSALVASSQKVGDGSGSVLRWIDTQGQVTQERVVAIEKYRSIYSSPAVARWVAAAAVPTLLPGAIATTITSGAVELEDEEEPDFALVLSTGIVTAWPVLLVLAVLSVWLAWLTYQRQKRYAHPRTGVWTAFVLLFGLPGYAGYRLHCRWPVRLPCPACNEPVPRDRDECPNCGEGFPRPAPKGIEVFA